MSITFELFVFLYQLIEMSCSSSNDLAVTITFFLTTIFSTIFTLVLTLLFVRVYIKKSGLTKKEPVKPVEQTSPKKVQGPEQSFVKSPLPLATNPAYQFFANHNSI